MQQVKCKGCGKVCGQIEAGKSAFKCKYCKTYTIAEVKEGQVVTIKGLRVSG